MHFSKLFFSALTFLAVASAAPAEMAGTEVAQSSDVGIVKYTNMNTSPAHSELTARVEDVHSVEFSIATFTGLTITRFVPVGCYTVIGFLALFNLEAIIDCKTIQVTSSGSITYFAYGPHLSLNSVRPYPSISRVLACLGDPLANWDPNFPPTSSCEVSK
ncbi:hypothetical protein DFH08DRAFT_826320 [Mycena albidolilacea]|uniref:Uncharacterized protein n=1 Tax=Mycena albidolilacea TaxID=1033008 RepID=A0AAD6Z0X3_9AGAR|nr:hypothetical protein DFH08DRAFT_826320 [Mycena albidolilacea]